MYKYKKILYLDRITIVPWRHLQFPPNRKLILLFALFALNSAPTESQCTTSY